MRFKKTSLLAVVAAFMPVLAHADLITNNYSKEPSTVRITNGPFHFCSGAFPGGTTAPGEMNHTVPQDSVNKLCMNTGGVCEADIYPSANCGASGAAPIGHAQLILATSQVIVTKSVPPFNVNSAGSVVNLQCVGGPGTC